MTKPQHNLHRRKMWGSLHSPLPTRAALSIHNHASDAVDLHAITVRGDAIDRAPAGARLPEAGCSATAPSDDPFSTGPAQPCRCTKINPYDPFCPFTALSTFLS